MFRRLPSPAPRSLHHRHSALPVVGRAMTTSSSTTAPSQLQQRRRPPQCPMFLARHSSRDLQPPTACRFFSSSDTASPFDRRFWKDLRHQAAKTLASSLSPEERQKLLQEYPEAGDGPSKTLDDDDIDDEDDDGTTAPHTIAEAVAQARAEEAHLQRERWDSEREQLLQEAEVAARARVEADLALQKRKLAFEQWQHDLKQQQEAAAAQQKQQQAEQQAATAESTNEAPASSSSLATNLPDHPELGPVLRATQTKRLHMVSAQTLANIPVWQHQRVYRHDRAQGMAKEKAKSTHLGLPGIITLVEQNDGTLSILDGQHRVGMMQLLAEKRRKALGKKDYDPNTDLLSHLDLDQIWVEVHRIPDGMDSKKAEDFATELFVEINKAEPVKLVDMPGVASEKDRNILTDAAQELSHTYKDMFKPSSRCRPPHVNLDNLRDSIFAANILAKHKITSKKALVDWILQQNQRLADKYQDESAGEFPGVNAKALEKAKKYQFFLGLESNWLYQ